MASTQAPLETDEGDTLMLEGFGVTGYRSFGPSAQQVFPLGKMNLIAGRNNSGKSNVLRLVALLQDFLKSPAKFSAPVGLDAHIGQRQAAFSWRFPIRADAAGLDALLARTFSEEQQRGKWRKFIACLLAELPDRVDDVVWVELKNTGTWLPTLPNASAILKSLEQNRSLHDAKGTWYQLWTQLEQRSGGSFEDHHGPGVLRQLLSKALPQQKAVSQLSAHRQIGAPGSTYENLNGNGVISRLLQLQNPELAERKDNLAKFAQINDFVAQVLEVPSARIEVPHTGRELNVVIGDRALPIDSLGTGVHEIVIFAVAATTVDNEILCIEEPEIHLHPRLQRKLFQYLVEQTNNQYFIATHSACLLDSAGAQIFHIGLNDHGESEVRHLTSPGHRASVGFDLGYRASDLVQSNAIIWVEGPSDRIYLNAWIKSIDPKLSEGLHYSVMFYGGRLLAHLTAEDESVADFIQLQKINRRVAIVIDSDKRRPKDAINSTKKRVLDEVERLGGFGWVTAGREVENYVPKETMATALAAVHPKTAMRTPKTQWDCCYEAQKGSTFFADKVALARYATKHPDLSILDLRQRVDALVGYINEVNR